MKYRVLAVDDDKVFLESLQNLLRMKNYDADIVEKPEQVINLIEKNNYQVVLLDVNMPGISGLDLLNSIISLKPYLPVVMISGQGNIKVAVDAIKQGAYDFIEKPLDTERLFIVLNNAIGKSRLSSEIVSLQNIIELEKKIIVNSKSLIEVLNTVERVAGTKAKVLITGESGTGKELIAFSLFNRSDRKNRPYVKLNCAAIPSELLESELFGHKRGSFTGAQQDRIGKFIAADGGTLFLDEIGDMSIELQAKLLRVLDEGEVEVVGENFPRKVDVRIISATNKNLKLLIEQEKFRKDLFHRLNVVNIHLQPLRERREDIIPLLNHFLKKFGEDYNKPQSVISPQAGALLENQRWEGNVRELKNVAEKLVLFSSGSEISINDVYQVLRLPSESPERLLNLESMELKQAKTEFEKRYIISVLESNDWKMNETAAVLGIDRTNLFKKMQILGIEKRVSQ